jgi:hypothetical protein
MKNRRLKASPKTLTWIISGGGMLVAASLSPVSGMAAVPDSPDSRAEALLGAAAAATGGAVWDKVRQVHLTLKHQTGDDTADAELWLDPHQGADAEAIEEGPEAGRTGFDGRTAWAADADGAARSLKDTDRAEAISDAFWRSAGWIRPIRAPASAQWAREEGQGSHARDVVRVTPAEGVPLDFAFDRTNHLPQRIIFHRASGDETIHLSQWRKTDGISLPWHVEIERARDAPRVVETVTSAIASAAVDPKNFAVPTAPLVDWVFPGEAASAELPLKLLNGHLYIEARIAKTRLTMLYDTAEFSAIDPAAMRRAGLTVYPAAAGAEPTARIPELGIGGVTLRHRTVAVRDLSRLTAAEGIAVDGVIGVELARRLVVELDYEGRRMVLLRPDTFVAPPQATSIPLVSAGRIPAIAGRIDGSIATLALDTGSASGLVIGDGFAAAHGFAQKWHAVPAFVGLGGGMQKVGAIGRAGSLELGVLGVAQPAAWLSDAVPPATDAILGNELLARYDVILDVGHGHVWLQPNRLSDAPDEIDRAGMALDGSGGKYVVAAVIPQGPAERAGLRGGDLVEMVGGDRADSLGLSEIRLRLKGAAGRSVTVSVRRNGDLQSFRIVLADPWPTQAAP